MTMPKTIPSLLGPVTVTQDDESDRELDKEGSCGRFSMMKREIQVSSEMPEGLQMATLGHEVMHVILEDSNMKHFLDDKVSEALCDGFGVWFAHMVRCGFIVLPQ